MAYDGDAQRDEHDAVREVSALDKCQQFSVNLFFIPRGDRTALKNQQEHGIQLKRALGMLCGSQSAAFLRQRSESEDKEEERFYWGESKMGETSGDPGIRERPAAVGN